MGDLTVRQWGQSLTDIRSDHVNRYKFAIEQLRDEYFILDAACGCGYGSWMLHQNGKDVTGIDIGRDAIKFARKHWEGPRYIEADLQTCNLKGKYDAIVSFETLEHLPKAKETLRKFRDVGDLLIASVPNEERYPFDPVKFAKDTYPHIRHYAPGEFTLLLQSADFEVMECWTQKDKYSEVTKGNDGMFLIYVCR
jgi:cyclopropane fatty-acyl-phospholipid synthase-like methyltransferase